MSEKDWGRDLKIIIKENLLRIEQVLYLIIALGLLIVFGLIIADGLFILWELFNQGNSDLYVIKFLDKVLVAMIVVELFYTVLVAIVEESALRCIEPFLLVGVTALVRRLLVLTFEIAHPVHYSSERITFYLIEMGLIGLLILVFVLSIHIFRRGRSKK